MGYWMSLRLRLIILPIVIVLTGLAVLAFLQLGAGRDRTRLETTSGMEVGRAIIENAVQRRRDDAGGDTLAILRRELPPIVRHVRIAVGPVGVPPPTAVTPGTEVPNWFRNLVAPQPVIERFRVTAKGKTVGQVVMVAEPDDELHEIWEDWRDLATVLIILSAIIIVVVVAAVTVALRPLKTLGEGLDRLGQGDFTVMLSPIEDVDLRRLGQRFNALVVSLAQATEDNRLLIGQLMSLQEAERKEIAHELHDEFGPSLFGIRAELTSISKLAKAEPPRTGEIEERVRSIGGLVEQIQRLNSRMLERLRPLVLDEMGLGPALTRLVSTWAERYPDIKWKSRVGQVGDIDETVALAIYRAVQECLTNVVRHAEARSVEVSLSRNARGLRVAVRDDGRGFGADTRFGFGLLGMAERARAMAGKLEVSAAKQGGAVVELTHPLKEPA
ncbi:histidine kinase [soil metagenome]